MRTSRVFLSQKIQPGSRVDLDLDNAHYVARVLRQKPGAHLILFDGYGGEFLGTITQAAGKSVSVTVGERQNVERESPCTVELVLGLSKGDRMDVAIQKAVELGVGSITPVMTERSVVRFDSARGAKRTEHWRQVVKSACEQCGRNRSPTVRQPTSLERWLDERPTPSLDDVQLMLNPKATQSFNDVQRSAPPRRLSLVIGPEGGFTPNEEAYAEQRGVLGVRFGPRILRAETAAIAALTAVQVLWGDLNQ